MDESTPALPFDFDDCDAFLVSLDENSALFGSKSPDFQLHKPSSTSSSNSSSPSTSTTSPLSQTNSISTMSDQNCTTDWSRLDQDYSNPSAQSMNLFNQSSLDPFSLQSRQQQQQQQQQQHSRHSIQHNQFSSNSSPTPSSSSSPISNQSMVDTDNNNLLTNGMTYQSNLSSPNNNHSALPPFSTSGSFDASCNPSGYPVSPQYHSNNNGSTLPSPDHNDFSSSASFDYSSFATGSNNSNSNNNSSNIQRHGLKMVPTILPHQALPLQLPLSQHSLSLSNSLSNSLSSNIKRESSNNMFQSYDNHVSPHTMGSPNPLSPKSYAYDDSFEFKDTSPSSKSSSSSQRNGSIKRERQASASSNGARIDTKGNKISKPKKEKTSHNMIEKRYRTNINDKILALRDCVPSLRCVVNGTPRTTEELEGLTPASKLNKATVLTKATEYILHLQKRNEMLLKELSDLRTRRTEPNGVMQNDMAPTGLLSQNSMSAYQNMHSQNLQQQLDNSFASKVMMCSMAGLMGAGLMNEGGDTQGLSFVPFISTFFSNKSFGFLDSATVLYYFKLFLILGTVFYVLSPYFSFSSSFTKKQQQQVETSSETETESSAFDLSDIRKHTWISNSSTLGLPFNFSSRVSFFLKTLVEITVLKLAGPIGYETFVQNVSNKEQNQLSLKQTSIARAIDAQLCGGQVNASVGSFFESFVQSFLLPATPMRYLSQAMQVNVMCHDNTALSFIGSKLSQHFLNKARETAVSCGKSCEASCAEESHLPQHIFALLNSNTGILSQRSTTQRLVNIAFNLPVSHNCTLVGNNNEHDDEGYTSLVSDKSLQTAADLLAAISSNSLLHTVLLSVLENEEIDFRTIEQCANIVPPRSIVARRVAIAEALLIGPKDAWFAKSAMEMLKEELCQQAFVNKMEQGFDAVATSFPGSTEFDGSLGGRTRANSCSTVACDSEGEFSSSEFSTHSDISLSTECSFENDTVNDTNTNNVNNTSNNDNDFLSTSVKSTSTPFAVSQDSRLGIRFSLISCYLSRGMTAPGFALLQKVEINRQESIGLLGFVAMWKVLREIYQQKYTPSQPPLSGQQQHTSSSLLQSQVSSQLSPLCRHKLEDLSAIARIWLGGNTGAEEGLSLDKLRRLVGESVDMNKFFGGLDAVEVGEEYN